MSPLPVVSWYKPHCALVRLISSEASGPQVTRSSGGAAANEDSQEMRPGTRTESLTGPLTR